MARELINSVLYPAGCNGSFGKYLIKRLGWWFFFFSFTAYFCVLKSLCVKRLLEFSKLLTRTEEGSKKKKQRGDFGRGNGRQRRGFAKAEGKSSPKSPSKTPQTAAATCLGPLALYTGTNKTSPRGLSPLGRWCVGGFAPRKPKAVKTPRRTRPGGGPLAKRRVCF